MSDSDQKAREEEVEALTAIFGTDFVSLGPFTFEISLPVGNVGIILRCNLPIEYPSNRFPSFELVGNWLGPDLIAAFSTNLENIAHRNSGNVVVSLWADWIRTEASGVLSKSGLFKLDASENDSSSHEAREVDVDHATDSFDNRDSSAPALGNEHCEAVAEHADPEEMVCFMKLDHMRQVLVPGCALK